MKIVRLFAEDKCLVPVVSAPSRFVTHRIDAVGMNSMAAELHIARQLRRKESDEQNEIHYSPFFSICSSSGAPVSPGEPTGMSNPSLSAKYASP